MQDDAGTRADRVKGFAEAILVAIEAVRWPDGDKAFVDAVIGRARSSMIYCDPAVSIEHAADALERICKDRVMPARQELKTDWRERVDPVWNDYVSYVRGSS